jgi:hypothetical protein
MRRLAVVLALTLPMTVAFARSALAANPTTSGCPPRPLPLGNAVLAISIV